jgi:flavin-dependent dehydrogenase
MTDPDVLVAGGGPAGSAIGGRLAAMGWRVLIVDRARFPRPKPCGECVNPGGVAALRRLGLLASVEALGPAHLSGWRLRGAGVEVAAEFGVGFHGLGISRAELDAALLDAARGRGAEVLEETRVEQVAPAGADGRPAVTLRGAGGTRRAVRPRVLVGADGLRSVTSRALGLVGRAPRLRKLSLTFHLRGDPPTGWHDGSGERQGVLDVRDGITLGLAPVAADGTRWNATLVADARRYGRAVSVDPVGFFRRVLDERTREEPGGRGARTSAAGSNGASGLPRWHIEAGPWASGPFDRPVRRCWAPGAVLVGDAAGYFDPFTGQGIYRALRSAELASRAVAEALAGPSPSWTALAAYDAAWRRETHGAVRVQHAVDTVMAHPGLAGPVLRRLDASGGLARVIRVTGDVAAPVTLLDPRVWL